MKKFSGLKLSAVFSLIFFILQVVSASIFPILFAFGIKFGIVIDHSFIYPTMLTAATSVLIGIVLSKIALSSILKPIIELNSATKKVSAGDFDVQISEKGFGKEISEMLHSFNIMTNELKNIETFRNDFVNNVSHEFKTPISAIEGYATLLQDENISDDERNDYVGRILYNSKRLSTLSKNILMIAKLENQEIVIDKTKFYIDEQIRNIILSLENLWSEKNISLDINMDQVLFYGNKSMLSHVWFNILSNAIKFTPHGGTISVSLKHDNKNVYISVADTGIGMTEDTLKHIFEKFYCGDKSRHDSGNGLGLTLAKRVVELCEGVIKVKSEKDLGTEFIITLPNKTQES